MPPEIPPPIHAFVKAQNEHDTTAVLECFTEDAVVHDEGRDHRGTAEIRAWSEDVIDRYKLTSEVLDVAQAGNEAVVTALVSGTFAGSPARLTWVFSLRDGKIAEMATR